MQHKTIFKEFTASILSVTAIALCAALWVHPGLASTASQADIVWRGCGITKKAFMAEAAEAYRQQTGINISPTRKMKTKPMINRKPSMSIWGSEK